MKKEKKLHLGKITIQDLNTILDRAEQQTIKGGSDDGTSWTTQVPVVCKP